MARRDVAGRRGAAALIAAAAALHAGSAAAEEAWPPPPPRYRLHATSILGGSFNAEGIEEQARLGVQMLLYRSDNPALRDNFVFIGTNPRINPTAARVGPSIEIQPLSVFNLRLNVEYTSYFGTFASVLPFPSPLAPFDSAAREAGRDAGKSFGTGGLRLSLTPFVQLKVGPIAVRNRFTVEYLAVDLKGRGAVYYEPAYDTLAPGNGLFLSDDLDLFYVKDLPAGGFFSHGRLAAGVRYSAFKPLFRATDYRPGEDPSKEHDEIHRVGPLVALSLSNDGYTKFHEPTIVAIAQWYAAHPNRLGKDMPQAVPYLVLAFIFQSDLWTSR